MNLSSQFTGDRKYATSSDDKHLTLYDNLHNYNEFDKAVRFKILEQKHYETTNLYKCFLESSCFLLHWTDHFEISIMLLIYQHLTTRYPTPRHLDRML